MEPLKQKDKVKNIKFLSTNEFSHEEHLELNEIETVVPAEETKEDASTPEPEWTANNLFEDMEADAGVRQVFASICPKVYQMFENPSKSQGDYTALINSLSNLVEQHLKSKSMKKLIQDDKRERFFA